MAGAVAIEKKYTNLIGQFFVLKNREILIDCCGGCVCRSNGKLCWSLFCLLRCVISVFLLRFWRCFDFVCNWLGLWLIFLVFCWFFTCLLVVSRRFFVVIHFALSTWLWDFAVYLSCFVSLFFLFVAFFCFFALVRCTVLLVYLFGFCFVVCLLVFCLLLFVCLLFVCYFLVFFCLFVCLFILVCLFFSVCFCSFTIGLFAFVCFCFCSFVSCFLFACFWFVRPSVRPSVRLLLDVVIVC